MTPEENEEKIRGVEDILSMEFDKNRKQPKMK